MLPRSSGVADNYRKLELWGSVTVQQLAIKFRIHCSYQGSCPLLVELSEGIVSADLWCWYNRTAVVLVYNFG
jgi:hypothetical protein